MQIDENILRKAIIKGLNRSAGKTVTEQANEIFNMIDILADIEIEPVATFPAASPLPQIQYNGSPDSTFGHSNLQWDKSNLLISPTDEEVEKYNEAPSFNKVFKPATLEMPTRIGTIPGTEKPIDGVNWHKVDKIVQDLKDGTPETIEVEVRGKVFKAHRKIDTGQNFGDCECAQIAYIPEGLSWRSVKPAQIWTTHQHYSVDTTLQQVKDNVYNFLFSITNEEKIIAVAPPPERMPTTFDDPSSQEMSGIGNAKVNQSGVWTGNLAQQYTQEHYK